MEIKKLLERSREIWGQEKLPLSQIIVRSGKVLGDICRWERNDAGDQEIHNDEELKKEMGNLIFCAIRWCDDLGYDPEDCIQKAVEAQEIYSKNR
jgi:hypothetical protein